MIDFIFQVDLSTIYIIVRRDFASPHDRTGTLTSPLGAGFYYSAAEANEAARQHCLREGASGFGNGGWGLAALPFHGEKDGLYRGGCVTREEGVRERFEVRVRRLKAKGSGWGAPPGGRVGSSGGDGVSRAGSRGSWHGDGTGERAMMGGARRSLDVRRPRTSAGPLMAVEEEEHQKAEEEEGEDDIGGEMGEGEKENECPRSGTVSRSSSALKRRGSRIGRLWGSIKRRSQS